MTLLQPGDELDVDDDVWPCDWCGRQVAEEDLTQTLDGAEVCPDCISHYDSNFDLAL